MDFQKACYIESLVIFSAIYLNWIGKVKVCYSFLYVIFPILIFFPNSIFKNVKFYFFEWQCMCNTVILYDFYFIPTPLTK